ncbi:MAG: hypothetical protein U5L46_05140 [Agrobacterium sp.]|nr:hypothetical protein [Agrobacterium sp.]
MSKTPISRFGNAVSSRDRPKKAAKKTSKKLCFFEKMSGAGFSPSDLREHQGEMARADHLDRRARQPVLTESIMRGRRTSNGRRKSTRCICNHSGSRPE